MGVKKNLFCLFFFSSLVSFLTGCKNPPLESKKEAPSPPPLHYFLKQNHLYQHVQQLENSSDERGFFLLEYRRDLDEERPHSVLYKLGEGGQESLEHYLGNKEEFITQFTLHPSGEITLISYSPDNFFPPHSNKADILRLDKLGKIKWKTSYQEGTPFLSPKNIFLERGGGEDFFLLTSNPSEGTFSLEKWNSEGVREFSYSIPSLKNNFYSSGILSRDRENLYSFTPHPEGGIQITKFSFDGENVQEGEKWAHFPEISRYNFQIAKGDDEETLYIADTTDTMIRVHALDKLSGTIKWRKEFSFAAREQIFAASIYQDKLLLAGSCGFEQASTGSITKHSDFLFFILDKKTGDLLKRPLISGTSRADAIYTILPRINGSIFLGGVENGPITHDGDRDPKNAYGNSFFLIF